MLPKFIDVLRNRITPSLIGVLGLALAQAAERHPDFFADTLQVADGLPVNSATAVRFGPQGFLWIATPDGLVRYDGVKTSVYRSHTHPALPSNRLIDLTLDGDGVLWLFAETGRLGRVEDGQVQPLGIDPGAVMAHRLDIQDRLWLATRQGIFLARQGRLTSMCHFEHPIRVNDLAPLADGGALLATDAAGLLRCRDGQLSPVAFKPGGNEPVLAVLEHAQATWVVNNTGLYRLDQNGVQLLRQWSSEDRSLMPGSRLHAAGERLWVRAGKTLYEIVGDSVRVVAPQVNQTSALPRPVHSNVSGQVWQAHGSRLYLDGELVLSLTGPINDLAIADHGGLWLATEREGVINLRPRIGAVFRNQPLLANANLYTVFTSRSSPERIWTAGIGTGLIELIDGSAHPFPIVGMYGAEQVIWTGLEDRDGDLWIGGLSLCRILSGNTCDRTGLPDELTASTTPVSPQVRKVRLLMQDATGTVWIGGDAGLYRHRDGRSQRVENSPANVRVGWERPDGSIWFGAYADGLYLWRDGHLRRVAGEIASPLIRSLYEDRDGVLWAGSEDQGLLRLTISDDTRIIEQRRYGTEHGLWDHIIHYIGEDRRDRLWMNSNRGIFWIERNALNTYNFEPGETLPVVGYSEADGLANREGNGGVHPAGLMRSDGTLWLPGQGGLIRIDTGRIDRNPSVPRPIIEHAQAGTDPALPQPAAITLDKDQRDLSVTYTVALFDHVERARFRYRLAGFEDAWREADNRREAIYTNLPAGDFQFEVMARSADGIWSESPARLSVSIVPQLHEQTWFLPVLALILTGLAFSSYRWRLRRLRGRARWLEAQIAERTRDLHEEQQITRQALAKVASQADRLRELDQAKSRFFTNLSHELRTPLTLIVGPASEVIRRLPDMNPEQTAEQMRAIRDNGERLLELVNQIQALSRLEAGHRPLKTAPGDMIADCRGILARFSAVAEQHRIRLIGPPPDACCQTRFDADALDKILANLLGNALRHAPEDSVVTLTLERITGGVILRVADQGPGIPADRLDRVFERFYTAAHEGTGSGIGLALARELARLHGGDLSVENASQGGCIFTLVLPLTVEHWQAGTANPTATPDARAGGRKTSALPMEQRTTILVIEDQPDVRRFVANCLDPDYRVVEAEDGRTGLAIAHRDLPDLVISDIMMPGLDGVALSRRLAADPVTSSIPVILLTARTELDDEIEGLRAGAIDYITKPFAPELLIARVRRLLGFARRLRGQVQAELRDRLRHDQPATERGDIPGRVERIILDRLDDENLNVETLARAMHVSRSQLKRLMHDSGLPPPSAFIRSIRLREAATLLRHGRGNVSEVAYAVGFASLSHFSRCFREEFGAAPTTWITWHRETPST